MTMPPTERPLQLTRCPQCGAAAEIVSRDALLSTDGPVEHVRVQCIARHWFLLPTAAVAEATTPAGPPPLRRSVRR